MEKILSYQRDFSALSGLQEAKTIYYVLTEESVRDSKLYGAQVTEVGLHHSDHETIRPFTDSKERAELLLTYLFENAVPAVHCRAVINDACTAFDGIGWDDHGTGSPSHCGR